MYEPYPNYDHAQQNLPQVENPNKNYLLALIFSFFLGFLGAERFYLGYMWTGVLKLLTLGGFGIWTLIDFSRIAFGNLKQKGNYLPLEAYGKYSKTSKRVVVLLVILNALVIGMYAVMLTMDITTDSPSSESQVYDDSSDSFTE